MIMQSAGASLRERLQDALERQRYEDALHLFELLEAQQPGEPRWPHRKGDLLKREGRQAEAIKAYEKAVELYAERGFIARAAAMAKVILGLDAERTDVLERVNPEEARRLSRANTPNRPASSAQDELELDFTKVELFARPEPRGSVDTMRPSPAILAQLPSTSLFADVQETILTRLVRDSTLVDLRDGERLVAAGTTADALFLLVEGNAVATRSGDSRPLLLGEGDLAGVSCLLADVNYCEDTVACGPVRAMRISKLLLDRLVRQYPSMERLLLGLLARRLVSSLLRTSSLFTRFDEETRASVARMFEVRKASAGTRLLEAGKCSDALYLPLLGRLVLRDHNDELVGDLKLGRPLGHASLLTRRPARTTVEVCSDAIVLRMSADGFSDLLLSHGEVVAQLEEGPSQPERYSLVPQASTPAPPR